jgi:hypothetical protein
VLHFVQGKPLRRELRLHGGQLLTAQGSSPIEEKRRKRKDTARVACLSFRNKGTVPPTLLIPQCGLHTAPRMYRKREGNLLFTSFDGSATEPVARLPFGNTIFIDFVMALFSFVLKAY